MKNRFTNFGVYTSILYILTACFMGKQLLQLQILKKRDTALVIVGIVLVLAGLLFLALKKKRGRAVKIIGIGFAVFFSVVFLIGGFGLYAVNSLITDITSQKINYKDISLVVLDENEIQTVEDIGAEDIIGYQTICYPESADKILEALKETKGFKNPTEKFNTNNDMVKGLYEKTVPIIILDEAYRSTLESDYPSFSSDTRVIYTINYPEEKEDFAKDVNVSEDSFVVLISGIDTYGGIQRVSRSDVNILVVVNPKEGKVLLVNIPRDYYVSIINGDSDEENAQEKKDKLTHAGLFGPQCTVNTIENLFEIPIHYYVRVNFASVVDIVDAIGGITVQSDYAFNGFVVGSNECDGERALKFARDRYSFIDGDRQRGKNQMKVIQAIISKLSNPGIKYDYFQLFQTVGDSIETNMTEADIKELIQLQVNEKPAWVVETTSVNGSDGNDYSYYSGQNLYVMYPNPKSVEDAKKRIRSTYFD